MATAISHSRVESYLSCRRKDWYGYQYPIEEDGEMRTGIRRQTVSSSLGMGTAFHSIAAVFYEAIQESKEREEAVQEAWLMYERIMADGYEDRGGNYATLEEVVSRWLEHEEISENYEILGVEMEFSLPMDDGEFPFVVDLIIRDEQDRIYVVDHKTAYYLYDDEKTDLMPQIPKYIGALRALGHSVHAGKYQVVRTQRISGETMLKADMVAALCAAKPDYDPVKVAKMKVDELKPALEALGIEHTKPIPKEKVYQFLDLDPSLQRIRETMREQLDVAEELRARDEWDPEDQDARAWRTANDTVCKHCAFRLLCNEELRGGNAKLVLLHEYEAKPKRDAIALSEEVDDDA
jgi:hypothetical protein